MEPAPKPEHPALEDIDAISSMLSAARDHATALCDAAPVGTALRSKAETLRQQLARAHSECTWLEIDLAALHHRPRALA